MNKKLISIASVAFAVVFLAIFIVIWSSTRNIIKEEANELTSQYSTEYDIDMSLFNNKVITNGTLINLAYNIKESGYSQSVKLKFYKKSGDTTQLIGSEGTYSDYALVVNELTSALGSIDSNGNGQIKTSFSIANENDVIDGLLIMDD